MMPSRHWNIKMNCSANIQAVLYYISIWANVYLMLRHAKCSSQSAQNMDILYENMTIAHDAMKKSDILVMYFLTTSYGPTIETNHLNKSYYSFYFIPMQPFINDQ